MVFNLIMFYYCAVGVVALSAFAGYLRGALRAAVRLITLAISAAASFPLARLLSYPFSGVVLNRVLKRSGETVTTVASANPELLLTLRNVISAILISVLTACIFALLCVISLALFEKLLSPRLGKLRADVSEKTSRRIGVCVGIASGLLSLFLFLTPVYFAASVLENTPDESLEAIDGEFLSQAPEGSRKPRSVLRLTTLKKGIGFFGVLSEEYEIQGFDESAQKELSNLLATAGDGFASYGASLESYPNVKLNAYLGAVAAVGANTEHSELVTSLIKGTARAVGNLKPQEVSEMLSGVPGAEIIGSVLPSIFSAIADTPDEEIPDTFATFFGAPPVEPARAKELREKAEKEAVEAVTEEPATEPAEITPPESAPIETEPPEEEPQTAAPETEPPATARETEAVNVTVSETAEAGETSVKPETTKAPETTKVPETTQAPAPPKTPSAGGSTGLIGALIGGGSVADKTTELTKNKVLFDSVKNAVLTAMSSKLDVTSEDYAWMYTLLRDEVEGILKEEQIRRDMSENEKAELFAASISQSLSEIFPPEAFGEYGIDILLTPSAMQVIALFTLDSFTLEKYPDGEVPLEDVMTFMGIEEKDIPAWVEKYE